MAQRSARREARSRAEADAGHRKRALLLLPARETQRAFAMSHGKRFVQREARPRAEADAGHRKRALLLLPARETQRAFAMSHGKRFVQREARPRAEADAGHRKRALLPLPARETKRAFAILYYVSQDKRFVQHEPHLPAIGSTARLHTNELRPLFSFHIINSRQPGDDLLRTVCCFFRFTKLN